MILSKKIRCLPTAEQITLFKKSSGTARIVNFQELFQKQGSMSLQDSLNINVNSMELILSKLIDFFQVPNYVAYVDIKRII